MFTFTIHNLFVLKWCIELIFYAPFFYLKKFYYICCAVSN
jgi:hypothetical protein